MSNTTSLLITVSMIFLSVIALSAAPPLLLIDTAQGIVDVRAVYRPSQFNAPTGLKNHHFIVWRDGKAGNRALFTTSVSDSMVYEALVKAGGVPGNNLTMDTWEKRRDKASTEPDKRVEGSSVGITIVHNDTIYTPQQLLRDRNGKAFDFRFGGNLALIPQWRSGCVCCLQSCPGGKIGNHTYTIRDLEYNHVYFEIVPVQSLHEGDTVCIRFEIIK